MEIRIDKDKHLKQIQEAFQKKFPYLKLEFYSNFHKQGEGSEKKTVLSNDLKVGDVSNCADHKNISIKASMKVSELEKAFRDTFGLSVQVFRKSNNLWLQTTITDSWPLSKQNQNAKEMNEPHEEEEGPEDYHEQE